MFNIDNVSVSVEFKNSVLVQNDCSSFYSNFISKLYIVYELSNYRIIQAIFYAVKNCLFGTFKLTRNAIKSKLLCNGQGIAFVRASILVNGIIVKIFPKML